MVNKSKVLDSSFIIALHSTDDSLHGEAVKDLESFKSERLIITDYVVHEIGNLLTRKKEHEFLKIVLSSIRNSYNIEIVNTDTHSEIENFLANIENTKLSYTDMSLAFYSKYYNYDLVTYDKELQRFMKKYLD